MEVDEQDREQVDSKREKVEARERERGRRQKQEQATHAQTCDIMDDMQMERMRTKDTVCTR